MEEVIARVSQLVGDHPALRELDISPWVALPEGDVAVDGRITVAPLAETAALA